MKNEYLGVIFTNHAINRLYNRNIDQYDAWVTLKNPDGSSDGQTLGSKKFYKSYGNQRLEVIAKKNDKDQWVILTCWAKEYGTGKPTFPQKDNLIIKLIKLIFGVKK